MAYAALVSLSQTTDLILKNAKYPLSDGEKLHITSIHEYVNFLLPFLEGCGNRLPSRKGRRIRDVANETEDIIELFMWKQIRMKGRIVELSRAEFERQLGQVTEEIGLIAGEMMYEVPPAGSSAGYSTALWKLPPSIKPQLQQIEAAAELGFSWKCDAVVAGSWQQLVAEDEIS